MLIRQATLPDGSVADVRVAGERIDRVDGDVPPERDERVIDATGKRLFPGMVDAHVHFREPGFAHKETWTTGSRSAVAGGVTTVVDQPNTDPPTVDGAAFDEKARLARDSLVDYALNGGVTADWDPETLFDRPLFALGEVFLADSTGEMGIESGLFGEALAAAARADVPVTVHAEDATRFDDSVRGRADADAWSDYRPVAAETAAIEAASAAADEHDVALHVAHTSSPEGVDAATEGGATCEVTPHHLFLSREDLADLGTFGRMNPPLRSESRRAALVERLASGAVDLVATDHAPHTRAEKDAGIWDAPSGVPGVETALPLLLEAARQGSIGYDRVAEVTARAPARVFDLPRKGAIEPGRDADLVLVDPADAREIRGSALHAKVDWTPFEGMRGVFPHWTMVRGTVVYERSNDSASFTDHRGRNVRTT